MKHKYILNHPRVKVFSRINHQLLKQIYNQAAVLVCPSRMETLHLAGIEAGACGLPIAANQVGIYADLKNDRRWGELVQSGQFKNTLDYVLNNRDIYNPRDCFLNAGLDKGTSRSKWKTLIKEIKEQK